MEHPNVMLFRFVWLSVYISGKSRISAINTRYYY